MNTKVYNIIWADDEIDTLEKDVPTRSLFLNNGINLLEGVTTSEELKKSLDMYKDKVDAVIIDANFSRDEVEYLEREDISGLIHSVTLVELYNNKRDIPFYLYTGRKTLLPSMCKNQELLYFIKHNRIFQKGELSLLIENLIKDVDHIHSIENMVNTKYKALFEIAQNIENQCKEYLHQFLLDEARDRSFDKGEDLFNQLRGIMEKIMECCKKNDIVPSNVITLNNFKTFYTFSSYYDAKLGKVVSFWKGHKDYKPNDDVMPRAIGYSIEKLIDIIQDGSHKLLNLNLGVSDYVQEAQTPYLFRSCLYQVMDIIRWYGDFSNKLINGEYKKPPYILKTP